jgi:hypothetical protein
MELFGSTDEETWEFIKRRIADCNYYVVIIADRYGSAAYDGLSYTEKEYDYAKELHKPVLAFIHGNRGSIQRDKSESDQSNRHKLESFITKVRRSPVSFYQTAHELAAQVTVNFVNERKRRPAVGFIRTDQAPNFEKYVELLELTSQVPDLLMQRLLEIQRDTHASNITEVVKNALTLYAAAVEEHRFGGHVFFKRKDEEGVRQLPLFI